MKMGSMDARSNDSSSILPIMQNSTFRINKRNEQKRINQENIKIATAMGKMKSTYDLKQYNKYYAKNLGMYRGLIEKYSYENQSSDILEQSKLPSLGSRRTAHKKLS